MIILIILLFIMLFIIVKCRKHFSLPLILTIFISLAIFALLIAIPVLTSQKQINNLIPKIIEQFHNINSKCFNDFKSHNKCMSIENCTVNSELIISQKYKSINKSSIILVSFTIGSFVLAILCAVWLYTPCPCGTVHDYSRI